MTRKPPVKLKLVKNDALDEAVLKPRDPRSLVRLDWYSAAILCGLMIAAPLIAGDFTTSSAVLPITSMWSLFNAIGVPLLLVLAALSYLPFGWREWNKPVAIGDVVGLAPSFTLLIAWAALSATRTPAMYLTVNALAVLCAAVMSAGIVSRLARDRSALIAMIVSITIGGTVVAAIGIGEYITYLLLHAPLHRSFSTFSDPNFLAGYLLLTIPIALSLLVCSSDARLRWLAGLSIVIQSCALWLSGSRSGGGIALIEVAMFVGLALFVGVAKDSSRWIRIGLALFVIGSLPAMRPLLSRLGPHTPASKTNHALGGPGAGVLSADAQVNSNEFRRWTWIGTARMARANPVLGTGFGAFDLSYARYGETAFTAHAHNGYLQLMAETGYPGVLLLLIGLAAAAAFAAHALMLYRSRSTELVSGGTGNRADQVFHRMMHSPEVLLTGIIVAIAGAMMHSLVDSDWYVVANVFILSTLIALSVALARDMAPLSTRRPAPLSKPILIAGAAIAIMVLWRGTRLASYRINDMLGSTDVYIAGSTTAPTDAKAASLIQATEAFQAAAAADPLNPEPHLDLAEIAVTPEDRLKELNAALAACRTAKGYYRLGQYYMQLSQWEHACDAFNQARELEPKMLQNLHALATAYLDAGKTDDAVRILQTMTALQRTPYGEVRAMQEAVETDFAYAHAMLGDILAKRGDLLEAVQQYEQARDVLSEYWTGRHYLINDQTRTDAKRKDLADLFETVLQQLQTLDIRLNRPAEAHAAEGKLQAVRQDRVADAAKP